MDDLTPLINDLNVKWRECAPLRLLNDGDYDEYNHDIMALFDLVDFLLQKKSKDVFYRNCVALHTFMITCARAGDPLTVLTLHARIPCDPEGKGYLAHYVAASRAAMQLHNYEETHDIITRTMKLIRRTETLHPYLILIETYAAHFFLNQGDLESARPYYLLALEHAQKHYAEGGTGTGPWNAADLVAMGLVHLANLEIRAARSASNPNSFLKKATQFMEQAEAIPSSEPIVLLATISRVEILIEQNDLDRAKRILADLITLSHRFPPIHCQSLRTLGRYYLKAGLEEQAISTFHEALIHAAELGDVWEENQVVNVYLETLNKRSVTHNDLKDLVAFLEEKDWYTGKSHAKGVASLSRKIGEIILAGMPHLRAESVDAAKEDSSLIHLPALEMAGLLHDVGKLRTPWILLNRIIPLTPLEWRIIRNHAIEGEVILNDLGYPLLGSLVGEHHERLDGSGYPRRAHEMSMMGAILAVADVSEAATSNNRKYKRPKRREEVLEEVKRNREVAFNPLVVDTLTSLWS